MEPYNVMFFLRIRKFFHFNQVPFILTEASPKTGMARHKKFPKYSRLLAQITLT